MTHFTHTIAVAAAFTAAVAFATALGFAGDPPASADQAQPTPAQLEGQRLLNRTLDAHGGLERFRSFGSLRYHTRNLPYGAGGLTFDHTADLVVRNHRMEGTGKAGPFIAAANGEQGWTTNAESIGIEPRWITHGNSYFIMMPFVFADPGANVRSIGARTFNGETYDAVAISYGQGVGDTAEDDYILYLDRETHRLRLIDFAVTYKKIRGDTPINQVPRFSLAFNAYAEVDGLLVPSELRFALWTRTETGGVQNEQGADYTVSNADFDQAQPDASLFEPVEGATIEE